MDTAVSDSLVGRLVDGRYQIEGRIARGGMSTVYYAVDTRLDRPVALKVMHAGLSQDPQFVQRFMGEAKAAARLSHPNVVAVFDQGAYDGLVYLAMEYVEGRTLREVLGEYGPLTPRQAFGVMEPVVAALATAHQAGLVHRDVKPENILLADDGRVKVADFGLARAVTQATTQTDGVVMGTVAYLAPEQVSRGASDPRSDIYSAGIVLYELLTGRKPFAGETSMEIAYQHVHRDVPAPSEAVAALSPLVDALVARATHRDPAQRPADGAALLADLTSVAARLTGAELDVNPRNRPEGRTPAAATLSAAAALATPGASTLEPTTVVGTPEPVADLSHARGTRASRRSGRAGRRRRRAGLQTLLVVICAALVVAGFAWWLGGRGATNVPAVIKMTETAAEKAVQDAHLKVQIGEPVFSEEVPADLVATSDPAPGTRVDRGSAVILHLSKGPERFEVPQLAGATAKQAEKQLASAHLEVGKITRKYDDTVAANRIISTDPPSGEMVVRGTPVVLVVSRGPQPIEVPQVLGRTVTEATQILEQAGFAVSTQTVNSDKVPKDLVMAQDPATGSAPKGSTVTLTASAGPQLVEVPDVRGMTVQRARQRLEHTGLTVNVLQAPFGSGTVREQSPRPGSQVARGSVVNLFVV